MRPSARGFTLIELLVVVALIGLIAVMAVPSMATSMDDRLVYEDASSIAQLIRQARGRAMGRGGSQIVLLSTSSSRGSFTTYESVANTTTNGITLVSGQGMTPLNSCRRDMGSLPSVTDRIVDGVVLDNAREVQVNIRASMRDSTQTAFSVGAVCFTALGRMYFATGGTDFSRPPASTPFVGALDINVARLDGSSNPIGRVRRVLIPSNGLARVFSG